MNWSGKRLVSILCVLALVVGMAPAALAVEEMTAEVPEVVGTMPSLAEEVPEAPEEADEPAELAEEGSCTCTTANPHRSGAVIQYPADGTMHYIDYTGGSTYTIAVETEEGHQLHTSYNRGTGLSNNGGVDASAKTIGIKCDSKAAADLDTHIEFEIRDSAGKNGVKYTINFKMVAADACQHEWTAGTVTKAATCTEKGKQTYTCTKCGATEERELDMIAHIEETIPAVPHSCFVDGTTAGKKCSVCNTVLEEPQKDPAPNAHTFPNASDPCSVCGLAQNHVHDYTGQSAEVTKQPTCTEDGEKTTKCKDYDQCGGVNKETVTKLGHALTTYPAQAATCTADGWGEYQACSRCDYTTKVVVKATGHDFSGGADKCKNCGIDKPADNIAAGGWFEAMYAELDGVRASDVTSVTYSGKMGGKLTGEDKQFLVRDKAKLASGNSGIRIDIPGIPAGEYTIKVEASGVTYTSPKITVKAHDRSGYAHWNYTEGVGAYRDDGILKDNAIVLYVTEANKNTVELEGPDGVTVTGIGNILNSVGEDNGSGTNSNGGKANTNGGILKKLANADIPLVVRFIGTVDGGSHNNPSQPGADAIVGLTAYSSVDYGGTVGDNGFMARMKAGKNITLEGIGDDAVIDGWGFHFMANGGDTEAGRGKNFEARNLTFRNSPEDSLGMEGQQASKSPDSLLSAPVQHCWVHNCAFYPADITKPAEGDKAQGDGACDFKRGEYFTMSYNYFQDCHKTNLIGANGDTVQFHLTFHHNYYVSCQSRGPLARNANIHMYNNYYEGQTDTVMSLRANCYVFSEYNWFQGCQRPVEYKAEKGTTGICKSYNDAFIGCFNNNDATHVTDKAQVVNSTNRYPSFELDKTKSYIPDGDYALDQSLLQAKANMEAYSGPMKSVLEMVEPEVPENGTLPAARIPADALTLPYDQAMDKSYTPSAQTLDMKKGISFFVGKVGDGEVTLGGKSSKSVGIDNIGYDVIFRVDKNVDITMTAPAGSSTAKTATAQLFNLDGVSLLEGGGTVKDCPPGIYYIQSNIYDTSSAKNGDYKYKEAKLEGLKIVASADQTPPHTVHTWDAGKVTVAASCIKAGTKIYTCSVCDETKREELPMTGHNMVAGACVDCGLLDGVLGGDPDAPEVPVTGLTLDVAGQTIGLLQGETTKGTATIAPANASDKSVTWESSDTNVATVSKVGIVTAKGPGTATITVTSNANSAATATFTVKVTAVETAEYTFSAKSQTAKAENSAAEVGTYGTNGYFTLVGADNVWRTKSKGTEVPMALQLKNNSTNGMTFTVAPGETADVKISFQSTSGTNASAIALKGANGFVATKSGDMVAVGTGQSGGGSAVYEKLPAGTYTIVAPASTDVGDEVEVDVNRNTQLISISVITTKAVEGEYVAVTGVSLDQATASVEAGSSVVLQATVTPGNASNPTVTWTSSDVSVATVVGGTVTGRKAGNATITAKAGSYTDTCVVTVTASSQVGQTKVSSITVTDEKGQSSGSVSVDPDEAQTIALAAAIEPDDADNKTLAWTSDATAKGVSVSSSGVVTVSATAESCTAVITATATDGSNVKGTYTLTVTAAGGTVTPDDSWSVELKLTNLQCNDAPESVKKGEKLQLRLAIKTSSYNLPTSITVKMGGVTLTPSQYSYNSNTGVVVIDSVTGNVVITAAGSFSGGGSPSGGSHGGGKPAEPTTPPAETPTTVTVDSFVDVKSGDWFYNEVKAAVDKGLIKGLDATHFAPEATTSRAMIATILFRVDGEKATNVHAAFDDVASGEWYSEAVEWAADKGIVKGYSDDVFAPNDNITREQLAAMLFRYANPTVLDKSDALGEFSDASSVSNWATEAMQWCVKMGIITGKGAGVLDPQGLASRAEAVTMLMRFVNLEK